MISAELDRQVNIKYKLDMMSKRTTSILPLMIVVEILETLGDSGDRRRCFPRTAEHRGVIEGHDMAKTRRSRT
jgi:hypothetical protein